MWSQGMKRGRTFEVEPKGLQDGNEVTPKQLSVKLGNSSGCSGSLGLKFFFGGVFLPSPFMLPYGIKTCQKA